MTDSVIILGGNALNVGIVDVFHSLNFNVVVVDFRKNIALKNDQHVIFDAADPAVAEELQKSNVTNVRAVYTSMDNAGLAQRSICEKYGLLHTSEEALLNASNKAKMHTVWAEKGLLNRTSFSMSELNLQKIALLNETNKLVIKPTDSCASRGITILGKKSDPKDITSAFSKAKKNSSSGIVNVEEFVDGTEFTVEMLGDNFGNVSVFGISKKYHSKYVPNNKIAVKLHYNASDVEDLLLKKIAEFGIECYRALGLKNTLGHLELIVKNNGSISPIELGARSSGFIASHLAQIGTSKVFLEEYVKVLNGQRIMNGLLPQNNQSAMYFFYDFPPENVARTNVNITSYLDKNINSLYYDRSKLITGKKYEMLQQDTDRYGYEILVGPRNILTIDAIHNAETSFLKDFFHA